jgi:hypothetical protein
MAMGQHERERVADDTQERFLIERWLVRGDVLGGLD